MQPKGKNLSSVDLQLKGSPPDPEDCAFAFEVAHEVNKEMWWEFEKTTKSILLSSVLLLVWC